MKKATIYLIIFVLLMDVFYEVNFPTVNNLDIRTDKVKEEIRIVQISDLHNKQFFLNDIFKLISEQNADFIVVTGDLIDKKTKSLDYANYFINELLKINPNIYYVFGDHEQKKIKELRILLKDKITILENDSILFNKNDTNICVYGLGYYDKIDFKQENNDCYSIALIHNPYFFINNKDLIKSNLILSGDTHGGQVRLPLIGAIKVPGQPFFSEYTKGIFEIDSKILYIDSGVGNTILPLRFSNQSQISLIRVIP